MKLISFTYCKAKSKDMITKKSGCLSNTPFHYLAPENEKILNYQNVGPWQVFDAHWYKCLSLDSLKNSKHRESLDPMEYISSFYTRLQWLFKIAHTKLLPKFTICVAVCANYANCSHWSPLGSRGSVIWISSLPGSSTYISMILSWHWPVTTWKSTKQVVPTFESPRGILGKRGPLIWIFFQASSHRIAMRKTMSPWESMRRSVWNTITVWETSWVLYK